MKKLILMVKRALGIAIANEPTKSQRVAQDPVLDLIINRTSPRAMSGESIAEVDLMSLFEAARWAPSSYNNQPWRLLYARRDGSTWDLYLNLLEPSNKVWVHNAGVLILLISSKVFTYNNSPSRTHNLDAGAAWENLALQGTSMGLVVHGMEGFDYDRARSTLAVPENYDIEMMIAVGKSGKIEDLPPQLQASEKPSDRKPVSEIAFEGKFPKLLS